MSRLKSSHLYFPPRTCAALLLLVTGIVAGCLNVEQALDPATVPVPPANDLEEIIALAIRRAVLQERDVPDYGLLRDKHRIVISSVVKNWDPPILSSPRPFRLVSVDTLSPGALPASDSVHFFLRSPEQIQRMTNRTGRDFLYLNFSNVRIVGDTAMIWVDLLWAKPEGLNVVYLSGGGYELKFFRANGNWAFKEVVYSWISSLQPADSRCNMAIR